MSYLVFGAEGQLGIDFMRAINSRAEKATGLGRREVDVNDHDAVRNYICDIRPDVVVNLTAFHNVEECQKDPSKALESNGLAVWNLARVCGSRDIRLVHVSTDYVFSGDKSKPYLETDTVQPLNSYGVSKALGEMFVLSEMDDYMIVRTSSLYGHAGASGKGGNFVETMLRLGRTNGKVTVVNDQIMSPTFTKDLAHKIAEVEPLFRGKGDIAHITNSNECTWFEFAEKIFELSGMDVEMVPALSKDFSPEVTRPPYSVLENGFISDNGIGRMRDWEESIKEYLYERNICL